jgi:prolyl oligopeptidase
MDELTQSPPSSRIEMVTDLMHGVAVADPYRWLEEQDSPCTRAWIAEQTQYARNHLDSISGRDVIRRRIRQFLSVETYDSFLSSGRRNFFRKRLPDQEQPCIYVRGGDNGEDQLLIDPASRGLGPFVAVRPVCVSPDGRLLFYEVKHGGERSGIFELLDVETRTVLPDQLPRGYLRGIAFAPDGRSFYYVHEALEARRLYYRAVYRHTLGTPSDKDEEIFFAGEDQRIRLSLSSDNQQMAFFVSSFHERKHTDVYLQPFCGPCAPELLLSGIDFTIGLRLINGRILAITDCDARNRRIVEIRPREQGKPEWIDIVPEADVPIVDWLVADNAVVISYISESSPRIVVFDFAGKIQGEFPNRPEGTVRLIGASPDGGRLLFETESFTEPARVFSYLRSTNECKAWTKTGFDFDSKGYSHSRVEFTSKDGTEIPMFLVGRRDVLGKADNPTVMTSYGGFGISMTPQFSVFVAFLMELGCLFALPNIRGGSEFGAAWHLAAKRRNRQIAFDDFLCAAEWLLQTNRTAPGKLAIFGGSNSGLLVGAALTQRPDLFRAAVCMVPILDMLRYHLFDNAHVWKEEFGTAEDPEDFAALAKYSPYHQVRDNVAYPATLIVSGDRDRNCNPLHARKMTARLQAASSSAHPVLLDYSTFRGHSPVLPLSVRIEALTDRAAFVCHHLQLPAER